jgi:hypothetical protein
MSPIYQGAGGPLAGVWDALGGGSATSFTPLGQLIFNQFRATGPNYTWANSVSRGVLSKPLMDSLIRTFGLPHASGDAVVPFFNVKQYESSGSSWFSDSNSQIPFGWYQAVCMPRLEHVQ